MYDVKRVRDRRLANAKTINGECGKSILINSNISIAIVGGVVGKVPITIVYVSAPSTNPDSMSASANSTEEPQGSLYEMGSDLRLIKPDAVGEKLQGWISSIAGVWPAKLDTDVVRLIDGSISE